MFRRLSDKIKQYKNELSAKDLSDIYQIEGKRAYLYMARYKMTIRKQADVYAKWIKENEKNRYKSRRLKYQPLISVVITSKSSTEEFLNACMKSIKRQTYKRYELLIHSGDYMNESVTSKINGEFVLCINAFDMLAPNALYEIAKAVNQNPEADFIYSDEDCVTKDGAKRYAPFFKPDWSPDTLRSFHYTGNLTVYRTDMVNSLQISESTEAARQYETALKISIYAKAIVHIPKVLYHRRKNTYYNLGEIAAFGEEEKDYNFTLSESKGTLAFKEEIYEKEYISGAGHKVSIIILSKDHSGLLKSCLESIRNYTSYPEYEILVIDNGSSREQKEKIEAMRTEFDFMYFYDPMEFNFSKMCNLGAEYADGDYLLFLNDDIEVRQRGWLTALMKQAVISHTGAVGAKLLYPGTNKIQHVGVTNYREIGPAHSLVEYPDDKDYYFGRNKYAYNYSAVTGACLLTAKEKFQETGGFDEAFQVTYNDVALCFSLLNKGYYNVVCNDVLLFHHESMSRGIDKEDVHKTERLMEEREVLYRKFPQFIGTDPFYNKNLSQKYCDFSLNAYIDEHVSNKYGSIKLEKELTLLESDENNRLRLHLDEIELDHGDILLTGWSFIMFKKNNCNLQRKILLINQKSEEKILVSTIPRYRKDVADAFPEEERILLAGFECRMNTKKLNLNHTSYKVGMYVKDPVSKEEFWQITDKILK